MEAEQQTTTTTQAHPHGTPSMGVATRVTMRVVVTTSLMVTLSRNLPLRYVSYGVDQAECAVEGIR
jgi:hypothetical protein